MLIFSSVYKNITVNVLTWLFIINSAKLKHLLDVV